ncbi:MAG TPA: cache domain-containing protein [Opitutaceae bacterium]|nr:cache domain-containing protein [Opitutaceae bacterium]
MTRFSRILLILLATARGLAAADVAVPARVPELARTELAALAADPVVVAAVEAQNARGASLPDVQAADKRWMETAGTADFMKACIESPAGQQLRAWRKSRAYVAEIILMDRQGANVAITEKTSDYWQGDEKKFSESFKDGGVVFVDKVRFDDSTQTYSVQVSVPVRGPDGQPIGVICIGLDIEKL